MIVDDALLWLCAVYHGGIYYARDPWHFPILRKIFVIGFILWQSSSSFGSTLSSDAQCSSSEPVHIVIIECRQIKCPLWRLVRGQEASIWSAVCSSAPHLQFAEVTKPHLCIVERNSPTPVRRRFSLAQKGVGRVIPGGEGPGDGINVWRREVFF